MTRKTTTRAAKKPRAKPAKSAAVENYDVSFEVILHMARFAKAGVDVNKILIEMVDVNMNGLLKMPEFLVAMGVIPRPADAVIPPGFDIPADAFLRANAVPPAQEVL